MLLRKWRGSLGLTQAECARAVGVRQPTWCDWEAGTVPRVALALRLEELTGGQVPVEAWADGPRMAQDASLNGSGAEDRSGGAARPGASSRLYGPGQDDPVVEAQPELVVEGEGGRLVEGAGGGGGRGPRSGSVAEDTEPWWI